MAVFMHQSAFSTVFLRILVFAFISLHREVVNYILPFRLQSSELFRSFNIVTAFYYSIADDYHHSFIAIPLILLPLYSFVP